MEETLASQKMAEIDLLRNLEKISSFIPNRVLKVEGFILKENFKEDELKKLFLMPKEINWPKLAEGYQVNFKSVANFKKLREALDWSISMQKSVIIKVDIDPENEICEKNALLEKIIGS